MLLITEPNSQPEPVWMNLVGWMKKQSHLAHLTSNRVGYLAMRMGLLDELERSTSMYFPQDDGKRAMDFLIEITQVVGHLGSKTLFVFVPEKFQVLSRPQNHLRAATLVQEAAIVARVPSIDLTPELVKTERLGELYLVQNTHWTGKGHDWIAQTLSEQIDVLNLIGLEKEK